MTIRPASSLGWFRIFGLLAIILPAVILAVLAYLSLRQWETSSEFLLREQARDMASMVAEKLEMVLVHTEDEVLRRIEAVLRQPDFRPGALGEILAAVPLIRQLFLFDRQGGLLFPADRSGEDMGVFVGLLREISENFWERRGQRHLVVDDQVILAAILTTSRGTPVLAALSRNRELLEREILAKTLGSLEGPTIVTVLDDQDRPVYTRGPLDETERIATVALGEALPTWRLALYQPRAISPRVVVRRQVTIFTIAFGLLLVVIVSGLVATDRLVRQETEMARLKADFVANVSHDLRTPLSLIRMFGETLEMGRVADDTTRQEYYRVITRESERLSRLIDNVLEFSRLENGRRTYDVAPTQVEPVIRETLEAFSYVLTRQGFKVEVTVPRDLPPVPMDEGAVSQALANLVDNAIKYSGEAKTLKIDARIEGDGLAIAVADEGIGIPPEEQPKIFDKFYRVGRSETLGRRGSGVGLALVRHVAEGHRGRVTVESCAAGGSCFTLWFPLSPSET